jgi:tetratricopeptide (TPR) repeat protein
MIQTLIRDTTAQQTTPALAALDLATLFNKLGEHERAKRIMLQLVAEHPGIPSFWHELAASQAAAYDFAAAEESAKRALVLLPTYQGARSALSLIRRLREDVLTLNDPATSKLERARFYETCGRIKDAEPLWLNLLAERQSQDQVQEALVFVAERGSSAAVSTTIVEQAPQLANFPQLDFIIREKHDLHVQLGELNILK